MHKTKPLPSFARMQSRKHYHVILDAVKSFDWFGILLILAVFSCRSKPAEVYTSDESNSVAFKSGCAVCMSLDSAFINPAAPIHLILWEYKKSELPDSLLSLVNVESIKLGNCSQLNLSSAFETLSHMRNLKSLAIEDYNHKALPTNISLLKNLTKLEIDDSVVAIPATLYELENLKSLTLKVNSAISDSLAMLKNLESLFINVPKMRRISTPVYSLTNLKYYRVGWDVDTISDSISKLQNLQMLELTGSAYITEAEDWGSRIAKLKRLLPNCEIKTTVP
jgi:Leucine-rich repeat (LRR) protein